MALYWPEARMAVECAEVARGKVAEGGDVPGVLMITMRPDQADDPEFVSAMQRLVMARTLDREREIFAELFEGKTWSEVPFDNDDERLAEAERRFGQRFMGEAVDGREKGTPSEKDGDTARRAESEARAERGSRPNYCSGFCPDRASERHGVDDEFGPSLDDLMRSCALGHHGLAGMCDVGVGSPLVQMVIGHCDEVTVGV